MAETAQTHDGRDVTARCYRCLRYLIDGVWQEFSALDVRGSVEMKHCSTCLWELEG